MPSKTPSELTCRELLPLYGAASTWQKAHKAYADASRRRSYPKGANALLDALLEAEQDLLKAISVAQRGDQPSNRRPAVRAGLLARRVDAVKAARVKQACGT